MPRLAQILDLINVYARECEVRPPGAPTIRPDDTGPASATPGDFPERKGPGDWATAYRRSRAQTAALLDAIYSITRSFT